MKNKIAESGSSLCFIFFSICLVLALFALSAFGSYLTKISISAAPTDNTPSALPIVIIDPGHGGEDCGTIGKNGVLEKTLNLQIAKKLEQALRACGIQTVMTRQEDVLLYDPNSDYEGKKKVQDLATREKIAKGYENAVFVSIHMNAFPEEQYSGLQVYYSPNNPSSQPLAQKIQDLTRELLQPQNERKIKRSEKGIYLLEQLSCPAVLVECGFLSNPQECETLENAEYQEQLALVLCLAISQNLSSVSP